MAIGVNANISSADLTGQGAGTKTVTKPAGTPASGDILVLAWAVFKGASNVTITPPSGWTQLATSPVSTTNTRGWVFWANSSVANLDFTLAGGSGLDLAWVMLDFSGVDTTTPVDATGTAATNSGLSTITANAVTIATANAWELIAAWDVNDGAFTATGFTTKDNGSTLHQRGGLMYNPTPLGTGSTGTKSLSNSASATSQELAAVPFALRPAAGGDTLFAQSIF